MTTGGQAAHKPTTANRWLSPPPCPERSARHAAQPPVPADPLRGRAAVAPAALRPSPAGSAAGGRYRAAGAGQAAPGAVRGADRGSRRGVPPHLLGALEADLADGAGPAGVAAAAALAATHRAGLRLVVGRRPRLAARAAAFPLRRGVPARLPRGGRQLQRDAGLPLRLPGVRNAAPRGAAHVRGTAHPRRGERSAARPPCGLRAAGKVTRSCRLPLSLPPSLPSSLRRAPAAGSGAAPAACACVCGAVRCARAAGRGGAGGGAERERGPVPGASPAAVGRESARAANAAPPPGLGPEGTRRFGGVGVCR